MQDSSRSHPAAQPDLLVPFDIHREWGMRAQLGMQFGPIRLHADSEDRLLAVEVHHRERSHQLLHGEDYGPEVRVVASSDGSLAVHLDGQGRLVYADLRRDGPVGIAFKVPPAA